MEDKYNSDDKITLVQDTPITSLGSEISVENTNNDIGNNIPSDVEDRNQIEASENTLGNNESEISTNNGLDIAEAVDNLDKTEVLDVVPSEPLVLSNDVNTTRVDASPVEDISNVDVPAQNIETQSNNVVSEAPQVTEEPAFSFDAPADVVDTANNDTQNQNNEDSIDTSNVSTPVDSENSPTTLNDVPSTNIEVTQNNSQVEPQSITEVPENNEVKEENNNDIVITSGNEEKTENKEIPENTKQENTPVPEKKKKNKSDIVITLIAVLVVILGIAGLLYYFVFSKNTKSAVELGLNTLSSKIYEINNNLHLNDLSKGIGSLVSKDNSYTNLKSGSYEIKLDTNLEDFKNLANYTYHFTYLNEENPKYNLKVVDNLFKNNVVNIDALGKDNKTYIRFNGVDANTYVTESDSNDIDVDNKIDINTKDLVDIDIEDLVNTITTSFKKNIKNVKVTKSTESIMINDVTYDTKKESLILTPTLLQNILNDVMDSNENYRDLLEDITFSDNVVIDFYVDKKTDSPIKIGYVNNDYDCDILFINDSLTLSLTSNADSSKVEMSIKTSSNSANMSMIVTSSLININLTADYSDLGTSMSSNIAVSLGNEEDTSNISLSIKGDYQNLESIKDIDISNPKDLSEFNIENYRFSFIGTPFYNMFF